jgi:hypothetical protein
MTWWSAGPSCPTAKWTVRTVIMQARHPRQRKNRQAPGLVSVRTAVVLTLALAVGAVTAMLESLAHEGPARIALTSLGAVGAAVLFFHTVIDAD